MAAHRAFHLLLRETWPAEGIDGRRAGTLGTRIDVLRLWTADTGRRTPSAWSCSGLPSRFPPILPATDGHDRDVV